MELAPIGFLAHGASDCAAAEFRHFASRLGIITKPAGCCPGLDFSVGTIRFRTVEDEGRMLATPTKILATDALAAGRHFSAPRLEALAKALTI